MRLSYLRLFLCDFPPTLMMIALFIGCFPSFDCRAAEESTLRRFDPKTIERLGNRLYRQDQFAARATDALVEAYGGSVTRRLGGWVTMLSSRGGEVWFAPQKDGTPAYCVSFGKAGKVGIKETTVKDFPEAVTLRLKARHTAIAGIPKLYTERYNVEVLDDPDGSGFLVYALAATIKPDEMIVGGHYRISVSKERMKAEKVDALSRGFLVLPLNKDAVMSVVTHIVSDDPVESHVFLSLLHKRAIMVLTRTHARIVDEGKIGPRINLDDLGNGPPPGI
jgi:hypothetical protein